MAYLDYSLAVQLADCLMRSFARLSDLAGWRLASHQRGHHQLFVVSRKSKRNTLNQKVSMLVIRESMVCQALHQVRATSKHLRMPSVMWD